MRQTHHCLFNQIDILARFYVPRAAVHIESAVMAVGCSTTAVLAICGELRENLHLHPYPLWTFYVPGVEIVTLTLSAKLVASDTASVVRQTAGTAEGNSVWSAETIMSAQRPEGRVPGNLQYYVDTIVSQEDLHV